MSVLSRQQRDQRAASFAGGRWAAEREQLAGEVHVALAELRDHAPGDAGLAALFAERRTAWRVGYAALQRWLQDGADTAAATLARLLAEAEPTRAAELAALLDSGPPTPQLDRLAAALNGSVPLPADAGATAWAALIEPALEQARRAPGKGRLLGHAVLALATVPGIADRAAAIGLELLGYSAAPDATLDALGRGSREPALLLHVAAMAAIPAAIEERFADLPPADWLSVMDALARLGFAAAARLILRCCVAHGVAPVGDVHRLIGMERAAPDGLDPLEILDVAVLLDPGAWPLRIERAKLLEARGQTEAALAEAAAILAAPPEALPIDVAIGAADLLQSHGRGAVAAAPLAVLAGLHPGSARLLGRAAAGLLSVGDAAAAEPLLRQAIAHAEGAERPGLLAMLARLLGEGGRGHQAIALLRPALAETPTPELAAVFVAVTIPVVWRSVPDYVDWALVADLDAALDQAAGALHPDRHWDGIRLFLALDRPDRAHAIAEAALPHLPQGGQLVPGAALAQMLAEFGVPGLPPDPGTAMPVATLADALHRQGLALLAAGRQPRAQICFRLAARLAPNDLAAQFNAGFGAIASGRMASALQLFDGEPRIYEPDMARVAWPVIGTLPWPWGEGNFTAAFEAMKPAGAEWPLITVVTPSYNQAAYVEATILSVLRQGYPNLQYIVVDGLSKDGSIEIIERYRGLLDTVIIEKDRGQTDAINKGFRLARGEIVTWLNSDDMFGPGALHVLALAWLRTRADILFGFCLPHRDHGFTLANLPQVRAETFTPEYLGQIFRYWMKGYFFYQPEVVFSRRILDEVGLLDQDLYFTMDYEFWLRCAKAGARVEAVPWPIALFRQHREQKTSNLLDCMLEQAQVRDRYVALEPPPARREDILARLRKALGRKRPRIGVVSSRISKIFSGDVAAHLAALAAEAKLQMTLVDAAPKLPAGEFDILVKLVHLQADVEELQALRAGGFAGPVVGWFWDNHHHLFANYDVAEELDIALPGHDFARHYLANGNALLGPGVPLCITQWSQREAAAFWPRCRDLPRRDRLYGGFIRYPFARKRNTLIEQLIAAGFEGVYFLEEHALERYFGLPLDQRFHEWCSHKVSITLPLAGDLSQRCFDALVCGQVPIVPTDVVDLDAVVPPVMQAQLPIIRFDRYDPASVIAAHQEALAAFDAGGPAAAEVRHRFALADHTFEATMLRLVQALRQLAEPPGRKPR